MYYFIWKVGQLIIVCNYSNQHESWDWELNLITIAGGKNHGQSIAAATYLKNLARRNTIDDGAASRASKEFRDVLVRALLQAEPAVLKVLIEAVCVLAVSLL